MTTECRSLASPSPFGQAVVCAANVRRRTRARGLTLVEVLMAAALIALLTVAVFFGSGMLSSNHLRASAALVVTGVRLGVTRANATGNPVRLVFDLDGHRILLEETTGKMVREKDEGASTGAGAEAASDEEREAREYADGVVEGPRAPRPSFRRVERFGADDDEGFRALGSNVRFRQVHTEHDGAPRAEGRAYLYIWPGGSTERAVVQLYRPGDEEGLTVLVSALTGRAKVERGRVELEEPRNDDSFGVREEE